MPLDIVIPAHNEQDRIDPTIEAYRRRFPEPDVSFHVSLDSCVDDTEVIVSRHAKVDPRVHIHRFNRLGKGGVLMETFRRCDSDAVAFVDADCATPPAELRRLVEAVEGGADLAIASRFHPASVLPRRRPLGRRMSSAGFSTAVRVLFDLPWTDTQCGAKVLSRQLLDDALPLLSSRDFVFDVDLLLVARELGADVVELPTVWVDQDGSHVNPVSDGVRMGASLLRLWLHHQLMPEPEAMAASWRHSPGIIDLTEEVEHAPVIA